MSPGSLLQAFRLICGKFEDDLDSLDQSEVSLVLLFDLNCIDQSVQY